MPTPIYKNPAQIAQNLIRFDTTNPPGDEKDCIGYINGLMRTAGIATTTLAKDPQRPNLIARLPGRGEAPPLLLYGHVDVVTTANQEWTHPPFEAQIVDGNLWGRGALDMKGAVAMMIAAILRAQAEGFTPAGDILFAALSDEEAGGEYGAKFLAEEHPEQFEGVHYALGEFGGANMSIGGKSFYSIQVAEKRNIWLKATFRGPGGHGAWPMRGGSMAKLSHFIRQLDRNSLPVHISPVVRQMLTDIAAEVGFPTGLILRLLLNPALTGRLLNALGDQLRLFVPMFYNTINATIVQGGHKVNVVPSQITLELDARLLPGIPTDTFLAELRALVGEDAAFEIIDEGPLAPPEDMGLFDFLAGLLKTADPEGIPIPMLLPAVTDGRFFAKIGIQTYGFTPLKLPPDMSLTGMAHAADERVPVSALEFGAEMLYQVIKQYRG